jgi:hypothetical protein
MKTKKSDKKKGPEIFFDKYFKERSMNLLQVAKGFVIFTKNFYAHRHVNILYIF